MDERTARFFPLNKPVDELDQKIISRLQDLPLVLNTRMSDEFGVANATIGARIKRLQQEGIARVIAAADIHAAGYTALAWVFIRLDAPDQAAFAEAGAHLAAIPEMISLASQLDDDQLVGHVIARDAAHLDLLLEERLATAPYVAGLRTEPILRVYKVVTNISPTLQANLEASQRLDLLRTTLLADQLEDSDLQLMAELQVDGRLSLREVSRRLNFSESVVRAKVRRLQEAKLLCFTTAVHPGAFGYRRAANVSLDVDPRHTTAVARALAAMEETMLVSSQSGEYRIAAIITGIGQSDLFRTLNERIRPLEGVRRCRIIEVVAPQKYDSSWLFAVEAASSKAMASKPWQSPAQR